MGVGVYIPNMRKPKFCLECWSSGLSGVINCEAGTGFHNPDGDLIPPDCPLIEIDLVRCGECKYVGTDATCCLVCCRDGIGLKPYNVYHDDFCSYGERRAE